LGEEIARGGMGVILRGWDRNLNRPLAFKIVHEALKSSPNILRRFHDEARILGQLQHPGVVPVHEVGTLPDGRPFFAMKLVKGRTLADRLKDRASPRENIPQLLKVFEQVCQTLAYAHAHQVIHRDLKPANVMVGAFGEVQVMDWGLAKVLLPGQRDSEPESDPQATVASTQIQASAGTGAVQTEAGSVLGTYAYMAPEQARGQIERVDSRSDVFGLGAILCEILTGQPPYTAQQSEDLRVQALLADLTPVQARLEQSGADGELLAFAKRCLAGSPEDRFADAGEVATAIAQYLAAAEARARQAELERARAQTRATEERKRRRVQLALAASLLALVALAGVGAWWWQQQAIEQERRDLAQHADEARRQERVRVTVEGLLQQVQELRKRGLFKQAETLLTEADRCLEADTDAELRLAVGVARGDLKFLATLDRIRQEKAIPIDGQLRAENAGPKYAAAFREFGWDFDKGTEAELIARLRQTPQRDELIAALDDWILVEQDLAARDRRWRIVTGVTGEAWRRELAEKFNDPAALPAIAQEVRRSATTPAAFIHVSVILERHGQDGIALLEAGRRRFPGDFWLSFELVKRWSVGRRKDQTAAAGGLATALAARPDSTVAWLNLGALLQARKEFDGALTCYRKAIALDPKFAQAHYNLGNILVEQRDAQGAIASYRQALALNPKDAATHTSLGTTLAASNDLEGGIAHLRKAIDLDAKHARAHWALGLALLRKGQFAQAKQATERCLELLPLQAPHRATAEKLRKDCERLLQLDQQWPDVATGKRRPRDAQDALAWADFAGKYKQHHLRAFELYRDTLAGNHLLTVQHGYAAATQALQAAAGEGVDARELALEEILVLQRQAFTWLCADLAGAMWLLDKTGPKAREQVRQKLTSWKADPALHSIRDAQRLALLPADLRGEWQQLWAEVETLLKKTAPAPSPSL